MDSTSALWQKQPLPEISYILKMLTHNYFPISYGNELYFLYPGK